MITLNDAPYKENVSELIERAYLQGILIDYSDGRLSLKIPEAVEVSQALLDELRSSKEQLIHFFRHSKTLSAKSSNPDKSIRSFLDQRVLDQTRMPLSFSQERLWVLDKLTGSNHYHIPLAIKWRGLLNEEYFEIALSKIIERHEVLRTVFKEYDGDVYQVVLQPFESKLCIEKISAVGEHAQLDIYLKNELQKPFDLSSDIKVRASIVSVSDHEHVVFFVFHHIATDGWSGSIFLNEFLQGYRALAKGQPIQLAELPIQYAEYAYWERNVLTDTALESKLMYWKEHLKDVQSIDLPVDFSRKVQRDKTGGGCSHILDASTTQLIRDIIIDQEVTLFMLMHTAISVLLFRYTGQTDICVATPVANRYFKEVEPLIGFFLNNLILRNDLSGNPPFSELLQKVKNNTLEAYDYQDVPFEKIVEALGIARDSSENPLFQVTITMHSHSSLATPIAQDDIEIELFSLEQETALFDLSFHISEQGDCIELGINYAADLFDQRTIAQMLTNLGVLLQSVVRDIHCPIEEMAVISAESISALKQEQEFYLNASFPVNKSIVSLFEEQVMTSPHRIAVSFEDETCTYATLNQRANQLADYLVQKGLPKEGLVMLCLERSVNMIVSMLAVAKAGGAYLPIGHDFPSNRVAFMLADAAPTFVVCQDSTQGLFEAVPTPCLINIDTVADELEGFSTSNLELEIKPDQLLYVIYTSGTTGQPKGAMITHQNVVRLFKTSPSYFDFSGEDVWSLFHNYYFDFSVWEIYGALLFGGRIEVVAEKIVKDTPAFLRFLSEKKVTVLSQTPAAFYNLQEVASIDRPMLQVRYVIFGGEALHPAKLNFWHNQYPACKLINMYGITETTVHVTYKEIGKTEIENGCSNIGKPIPTLGVFVLDKHHNLLPKGASGELFVTGYGLAKGYLNRAELTATRFIQIPALGNQYFYKTGDIVQMSPDGDLRYIGRTDHQVKIRGHRIELGEIENTLLQIQGINQCCVILYTTAANIQQLVAYFVSDKAVDKQQLKKALAKTLPAYMIPAVFIPVNKLPINENGKIDRKSLPVPSEADLVRSEHVHPSTVIECKLAEIWKRLLQLQYIGIHDNFFTVGGDSILVIKAISELQKEFSVQMPVVEFYNSPTIADVASYIEVGMLHSSAPISGLDKVNEYITNLAHDVIKAYHTTYELEDAYPMTDIQKGMVFASIADRENAVYHDQMAYPIRDVHIDTFKQALALVVQKHPILRTAYNFSDFKEEVQLVFKDVPVEVSTYDIADLSSKEQEQRLVDYQRKERERPFDFAVAPLWRATIFNCGNNISVHVFQFHHSILDGWSFASLVQELNEVYWALLNNPYHSLNLLQCNWRDVISNSLLQKADERGLEYWKQKLADYKRTSFFTEEEVQERLVVAFDYQKLTLLKSIAIEFNVSLKTIFLGIYLQVVRLFTYHREVTIGFVANTRPYQQDGEKILGCFLNTIPFRYEFSTMSIKWKDYLDDIERELLKLKSFDQVTLFEIAKSMGEQVHDKSPFFDLIFNFTDFHVLHAMPTEQDYQEEALYETPSLHLPEYTATNTFLDCTVSITGNQLKFGYWQRKAFAEGISLAAMGEAITTIMDSFLQNPAASIDPASFLLPSDQAIIHHKFNQTDYTFDGPKTLVALLEQQATQTPSAIATTIGNNQLSYAALHQKAKQLAHILLTYTTVTNQPIAVCLERSNEMMVAILAILKAGGAYVPLDPWYPVAHLAYVVNDTQTQVVITEKRFASLFEQSEHLTCLLMDELPEVAVSDLPLPAVMPQQAAYVIYTSGSTGQPKGVVISHESIVNRLLWMQQTYWLQPDVDIVLQKTTYCFDVSVWELFWPLITGSKLVFAKPGGHKESQYLKTLIEEEGITTVHFVPSMLEVFLLYIKPGDCPSLQRVICSGEALLPAHVNTFNQKLPGATLHNLYGPTEATVDVTYWEAPKNESVYVVPIGKPVANTRLYVVREDGLPCGIGVPGELHIAGIQLAKGYLNKPELTHAKFVYSEVAKERVYKTGDLAYWMPDGNIGYLGRIDQQVKIRGHRIELGEIEQVLLEAPGVWQSAVTVVADAVEGKKMYAYVVANDSTDRQQLLDFVASRLPDFMVPSTIVFLDEMPLTANGKLNRSALPVPTENDFRNVVYEAPVNSVERTMAQIWMTYLGLSKVGRNDHFFQVGGNSLTATRVVIAIQKEWGLALSVKDIFQYPVLETLCKYIALESLQDKQDEEQAIYDL